MKKDNNQHFSIYITKSIVKSNITMKKIEGKNIPVKKLMSGNVAPQVFYKPITKILNIETDVP